MPKKLVKEGKPQVIANTVWACAKLVIKWPNLEGNPQEIAITGLACAKLGFDSPRKLFMRVEKHACQEGQSTGD
eukprot:scaffold115417_cov33-Attheya_sp.AAC.3